MIGFSITAYVLDFPRLYVYGLLLSVAPLVGEWLRVAYGVSHRGYSIVFGISAAGMILTYLFVVESADNVFLIHLTRLTWVNLVTHLGKLEEAGYVEVQKTFNGKKPQSVERLTEKSRAAFREYKRSLKQVLEDLPD